MDTANEREVAVRAAVALIFVILFSFAGVSPARAAVSAETPDAVIALSPKVFQSSRLLGDFSVLIWIRPDEQTSDARNIFEIPGVLTLGTSDTGSVSAALVVQDSVGSPSTLTVDTGRPLLGGQWQVVCVSFRKALGYLDVFHSDSTGAWSDTESAGFESRAFEVDGPGVRLGQASDGTPAVVGAYGLLAIRTHSVKLSDVATLRQTRRYFSLYDYAQIGSSMNGPSGAMWMLNHAMTTLPVDYDAGGSRPQRAAVVGQPVGLHNVHVWDSSIEVDDPFERFNMVRQADEVRGFRYVSTREPPLDGWFLVDPGFAAIVYDSVPGESALAHQLATEPRRPIRVFVSSNSRAVFRDDGTGVSPGNYAQGFFDYKRAHVSGVLFRPVVRGSTNPWFGFNAVDPPAAELTSLIDSTGGAYATFARFWTGSARAPAEGPGAGLFIQRWGRYELRCRPEPGSLLVADAPLVVQAHVMAFPGASPLQWRPRRGLSQSEVGVDHDRSNFIDLDTTRVTHVFSGDDLVYNSSAISIKGQFEGLIFPGDAMYIASGPGRGQINVIRSVTHTQTRAVIEFDSPMIRWPEPDVTLRFGPWRFETLEYTFPPVADGDAHEWRGLELRPVDSGEGVPVFAYSAFRPDVNGYQFGVAGWGGNGYYPQIIFSEPAAISEWMRIAAPDLWIQVPAQQNSLPEHMSDYTALIRQAAPECEIVWAAEAAHPSGVQLGWVDYIVDHAESEGVIGIVALNRPQIGTELEQLADGHRSNLPHISARGNVKLAELWCQLLLDAAIDPCPADFAPPWHFYDFFDVQVYLAEFVSQTSLADLTGDGIIDFFDLVAYLDAFAAGCG